MNFYFPHSGEHARLLSVCLDDYTLTNLLTKIKRRIENLSQTGYFFPFTEHIQLSVWVKNTEYYNHQEYREDREEAWIDEEDEEEEEEEEDKDELQINTIK